MANTKFQSGEGGRPKGASNKSTKAWADIRKLAVNDYESAYKELRAAMTLGEGWAHALFFNKLVPKKNPDDCISIEIPQNISGDSVDAYLKRFIEALKNYQEYTMDEWVQIVSVLNRIKFTEKFGNEGIAVLELCNQDEMDKIEAIVKVAEKRSLTRTSL
jgi:hypothetical protein